MERYTYEQGRDAFTGRQNGVCTIYDRRRPILVGGTIDVAERAVHALNADHRRRENARDMEQAHRKRHGARA